MFMNTLMLVPSKDVLKLTREKLHFEVTDSTFLLIFPEKVITKKIMIITKVKVKVKEGLCRGCLCFDG